MRCTGMDQAHATSWLAETQNDMKLRNKTVGGNRIGKTPLTSKQGGVAKLSDAGKSWVGYRDTAYQKARLGLVIAISWCELDT